MQDKLKGYLAITAANVIFGLNTPIIKSLISHWMTPVGYTLTRVLFGCLMFWTIGSLSRRKEKVSIKDLVVIAVGGLFGFVGTQFFALALRFTTPVNFSLMAALTPVLVLVLYYF